ncbi:MAG: hypothetical protein LBE67_17740 [Kocuria palustris]|nr:hypothetical protein [Kocuria palustris]
MGCDADLWCRKFWEGLKPERKERKSEERREGGKGKIRKEKKKSERLTSLSSMTFHPSICSSPNPVRSFNSFLALPLLVAASRANTAGWRR